MRVVLVYAEARIRSVVQDARFVSRLRRAHDESRLSEEGTVHELRLWQHEIHKLRLQVEGHVGRTQEGIRGSILATEIGFPAMCEDDVGIVDAGNSFGRQRCWR
jgi:hypothetical protein